MAVMAVMAVMVLDLALLAGSLPLGSVSFEERFLIWREAARKRPVENRPRYIACTEAASIRAATCRRLLRTWPGGPVDDFRCVVGGLSGFDCLEALVKAKVAVRKLTLFDLNPMQLLYGELMLELVGLAPSRDAFLASLFGRSEHKFGRVLGVSNMMDFLDLPVDSSLLCSMQLPERLRGLYATVVGCISEPSGWPVAWPSFGQRELIPKRRMAPVSLTKSERRLGGQKNEAFHINEEGWLKDESSYRRVRALLMDLRASGSVSFELMNLKDVSPADGQSVLFISNIDGSPQFLADSALDTVREGLIKGSGGTLLLSTRRAEWLTEDSRIEEGETKQQG
ncbi:Pol [Symbiodinium natans]|uniref:Pol protein n=1 Tax=Symbiodinium natans TaxID=878477 RepID=A0A812IGP2_9DINO|nr:Pol [Symbiodinium natans]